VPTPHDCASLVNTLTSLDVPIPKPLADTIATFAEIDTLANGPTKVQVLQADVVAGKVKPGKLGDRLTEAAQDQAWRAQLEPVAQSLVTGIVSDTTDELRGEAGDQIIESLRPRFNAAVDGIHDAAGLFGPDSEPAHVLAMGAKATNAYNAMPQHRATLDTITGSVLSPLTETFGVLGERDHSLTYGYERLALTAWLINPDNPDKIHTAARMFGNVATGPGGRWHWLTTAADLHLNTPAEARSILDHLDASLRTERDRSIEQMVGTLSDADLARLS
jgi:hypothetical protein